MWLLVLDDLAVGSHIRDGEAEAMKRGRGMQSMNFDELWCSGRGAIVRRRVGLRAEGQETVLSFVFCARWGLNCSPPLLYISTIASKRKASGTPAPQLLCAAC